MKILFYFLSFFALFNLASLNEEDDDEFSIPNAQQEQQEMKPIINNIKKTQNNDEPDYSQDVGDVPPATVQLPEVDLDKLPLLDWRTVKPSDFWFEVYECLETPLI